jgi:hypothetical protein
MLTAVATDADGGTRNSAAVSIAVNAVSSSTRVTFTASADHDASVTSYLLEVFAAGADPNTSPAIASTDLGKPTPDASRDITTDETSFFSALSPGNYSVTVAAVGAMGARGVPGGVYGVVANTVRSWQKWQPAPALPIRERARSAQQYLGPGVIASAGPPARNLILIAHAAVVRYLSYQFLRRQRGPPTCWPALFTNAARSFIPRRQPVFLAAAGFNAALRAVLKASPGR